MPYQHLHWSVERDRDVSRSAAEQSAIRQALSERQNSDISARGLNLSRRRFLRRRTVEA